MLIDAGGQAVAPAIVWHDRRTEPQAQIIAGRTGRDRTFAITGQDIIHTFTLAKLMWMREHWPDVIARAHRVLMMALYYLKEMSHFF